MNIDKISIYPITLPFSFDFSHALSTGTWVENVIVEVVAQQGDIIGFGEGAPRSYVTGESRESVVSDIHRFAGRGNFPWTLHDIAQLWDFVDDISHGKKNNAAICAIETAILDALARSRNKPVLDYFSKRFYRGHINYGAAIPLAGKQKITELCRLTQTLKIDALRLKFGQDLEQNKKIIETVHSAYGGAVDLRVDINGVWTRETAFKHIPLLYKYKTKVVEQPMAPKDPDIADFAKVMRHAGVALMADESVCSLEDAENISKDGYYDMVNVRLSKCGGFRNALKIIDYLRTKGVLFQIGCHLGESGLLSAAGRVLCLLCKDAVYYDGSYDEFLLKKNTTTEHVSFSSYGKAEALKGPGLGVNVNRRHLASLCDGAAAISISNPYA
jgi:muconate cycloisomerase